MDAIYARQSVDKADSLSIQGQIDLCRQKAGAEFRIYQDKGYSGKNTNRPAFQRMIEDVEKGLSRRSSSTGWTASPAPSPTLGGCGRS